MPKKHSEVARMLTRRLLDESPNGLNSKELAAKIDYEPSSCAAILRELKALGQCQIIATRDKSYVYSSDLTLPAFKHTQKPRGTRTVSTATNDILTYLQSLDAPIGYSDLMAHFKDKYPLGTISSRLFDLRKDGLVTRINDKSPYQYIATSNNGVDHDGFTKIDNLPEWRLPFDQVKSTLEELLTMQRSTNAALAGIWSELKLLNEKWS